MTLQQGLGENTGGALEYQLAITDIDNQMQAIQNENVALKTQRNIFRTQMQRCQEYMHGLITNHRVSCAKDPGKDVTVMIN